jgi:hypothetical protein
MSPETDEVFREKLSEPRNGYYVEYSPVVTGQPFASLNLVFTSDSPLAKIHDLMDDELTHWLARFSVPLFVSSFDAKGDVVQVGAYPHLMGYIGSDNKLVKRWGPFKNEELPPDQVNRAYLAKVYRDIPYRFAEEVRHKVRRQARFTMMTGFTILSFTVVVPVLIELISLGIEWLSHVLEAISISKGIYEIAKAFGFLKPSRRGEEKALKRSKMEHYFYHCEKNPTAFQRLKLENFESEEKLRTLREDAALRQPSKCQVRWRTVTLRASLGCDSQNDDRREVVVRLDRRSASGQGRRSNHCGVALDTQNALSRFPCFTKS